MRFSSGALALLCAGIFSSVSADGGSPGYLALPITARTASPVAGIGRRAGTPDIVSVTNDVTFYAVELSLGTPLQQVSVILDTGSAELWVDPDCSTAPYSERQQCEQAGAYDPNSSNTPPSGPFGQTTIQYGDPTDSTTRTSVTIGYFTDALTIGGASLTNQTFGVVLSSQGIAQGILGLGPDLTAGFTPGKPYSLLLNTMAVQGVIASRAFTLDLRSASSDAGAVIFGGLDLNSFSGPLVAAPLVKGLQGEFRLAAAITGATVTLSATKSVALTVGSSAQAQACLLDSGSSLTRLNPALAAQIISALGGVADGSGMYAVSCSLLTSTTASVGFTFQGGGVVQVPMADFLFNNGPTQPGGPDVCYIAMVETTDLQVLGDPVLRAAYLVFDWDNQTVHIAQAASCGASNIVTISSGVNAIPSVTGRCGAGPTTAPVTSSSVHASSYTTVVTVSHCPALNPTCQTGVATQTVVSVSAPSATNAALPLSVGWGTYGLLPIVAAAAGAGVVVGL